MKIKDKIFDLFENVKEGFKNYPFTIMGLVMVYILAIIGIENEGNNIDIILKLLISTILFIPISLNIREIKREYDYKKIIEYILYGISYLIIFLYYNSIFKNMVDADFIRFVGLNILFYLIYFFIKKFDRENYSKFMIKRFGDIFLSGIFSLVLLLGLLFILFTVNSLFNLNISGKFYLYILLFVAIIFFPLLALSRFVKEDDYDKYKFPKAFKNLLLYIIMPLSIIYITILYVYFLKIVLTRTFPQGIVSHLVLWYSIILIFVMFFIKPLENENRYLSLYRKIFPIIIIPILIMMFVSMGIRVNQYGITENRYFVLIMGIWILISDLYILFKKDYNTRMLPAILSIFILISIVGPLSSFNISIKSQKNRYINILERNNMLVDGKIVPTENISKEDQVNISDIVDFFRYRDIENLIYLEEDFNVDEMKNIFGFEHRYFDGDYYNYRYYYLIKEDINKIDDYDYSLKVNSYKNTSYTLGDIKVEFNKDILTIYKDNKNIGSFEFNNTLDEIVKNNNFINNEFRQKDITIVDENENVKIKLLVKSFNFSNDKVDQMEFDLYFKIK